MSRTTSACCAARRKAAEHSGVGIRDTNKELVVEEAGHHELVGQTGHHSRRVEEGVVMGSGGRAWLSLDS